MLPISEKFLDYGRDVRDRLLALGVRCELDESNEKIGYKIRQGEQQKIPYLAIVGEKELAENTISVRKRKEGDQGAQTVEAFAATVAAARK